MEGHRCQAKAVVFCLFVVVLAVLQQKADPVQGGATSNGKKPSKKPVEEKPTVGKADRRINAILSVVLGCLCVAWIYPIVMIFFNSRKTERAITTSRAFGTFRPEPLSASKTIFTASRKWTFVFLLV